MKRKIPFYKGFLDGISDIITIKWKAFSYKPDIGMDWDMSILDKRQMFDEDIKFNFITLAL